jgi:hypothetical protein
LSLPNSDGAEIDAAKVRDYLLSEAHPVGRFKAAFFVALGYSTDHWELLRDDLLTLARAGPASPVNRVHLAGHSRSMVFS